MLMAAVCMTLMFAYMAQPRLRPAGDLRDADGDLPVSFRIGRRHVPTRDGLRLAYTVGACVAGGLVSLALVRGPDAASTAHA